MQNQKFKQLHTEPHIFKTQTQKQNIYKVVGKILVL